MCLFERSEQMFVPAANCLVDLCLNGWGWLTRRTPSRASFPADRSSASLDPEIARAVSDQIVFMDAGRIVETGEPNAFFDNPQTERAQKFLDTLVF